MTMAAARRPVFFNSAAQSWSVSPAAETETETLVDRFHRQLPDYRPTHLVSLDHVAKELGVRAVYLKDESSRLGLPSFKILGASWGTFRAITQRLGLPLDTNLDAVRAALVSNRITLYAATDGNHGRALARMASILGISAEIHVPACMHRATIDLIKSEGARVVVSSGYYDAAVSDAHRAAQEDGSGICIQDFAFRNYEEIPQWIVDGYLTMMREVDQQMGDNVPDLVIAPVGVGSFAQAVVTHFKKPGKTTAVMTVEPDTAACLWNSLRRGQLIATSAKSPSIMAGLDCATPSSIAWPVLQSGVDASLSVSDYEAHEASVYLNSLGLSSGPCGAAPLAALRRLDDSDKARLGLGKDSVVVMFCTEGARDYDVPHSVSSDDPVALTQTLVQINSANPSLGSVPGPGETAISQYITAWLEHRDIESHWIEPTKGRPSVVGVARGSGGGKSLMFNGYIDTVTIMGYEKDPLGGEIKDGKLYGRGAADMKCGVAAAMVALANAKKLRLKGDVIFTGVADEEYTSIGTEQVLQAGWRADAAVVSEPTDLEILHAHKGFVWIDVNIHGLASHGSRTDLGIDAICKAGHFLVELEKYAQRLQESDGDATMGLPSVHASIIKGGEEESSYPALCTVMLERRTISGETVESVTQEITDLLEKLVKEIPNFKYDLRATFDRPPFKLPLDHAFMKPVRDLVGKSIGKEATVTSATYWTDCALLAGAGIPALLWGPKGAGLHVKEEWVEVESIKQVTEALTAIAVKFCN